MKSNPYAFLSPNPYAAMYAQPFPMKTPEQYQQELLSSIQPQMNQYKQMYEASQEQAKQAENSGTYFKVSSYEEMMKIPVPADHPIMVLDEQSEKLYSKRFDGGKVYIVGFQLTPLEEEKKPEEKQRPSLEEILTKIDSRLSALEKKK